MGPKQTSNLESDASTQVTEVAKIMYQNTYTCKCINIYMYRCVLIHELYTPWSDER